MLIVLTFSCQCPFKLYTVWRITHKNLQINRMACNEIITKMFTQIQNLKLD
jgi:hypothetical protein